MLLRHGMRANQTAGTRRLLVRQSDISGTSYRRPGCTAVDRPPPDLRQCGKIRSIRKKQMVAFRTVVPSVDQVSKRKVEEAVS